MKKRGEKTLYQGFTLLEMMVVLLILSVLVLLFIPNITSQKDAALAKSETAVAQTIKTELELAKFEKNRELNEDEIMKIVGDENSNKYQIYLRYVKDKD